MVRPFLFSLETIVADFGRNIIAPSAILMCAQKHSCVSVMNAISVLTADDASSVVLPVRPLLILTAYVVADGCISRLLGISDAYYCAECTRLEKDRDGCPKIVNLGASRTDLFYERRRLGTFFRLF